MEHPDLTTDCVEGLRAALPRGAVVHVRPEETTPGGGRIDGWLRVRGPGGEFTIPVETKPRVNRAAIALMDRRLTELGRARAANGGAGVPHWMLFTEHVTTQQAHDLRTRGIAFADTCGNANLWGPGLFVWVTGNRPRTQRIKTPRLTRAAAARVLFTLLQDPRRAREPYRELATQAGVAPDTVHRVFHDLEGKGYLKIDGTRKRRLARLPEVLELWMLAYEDGLRPKLQPRTCDWMERGPIEELLGLLPQGPGDPTVLVGGEAAAAILTDAIRPTTATLHVPKGMQREAMRALRLVPRPDGKIVLIHTFGKTNEWAHPEQVTTHLADPLLVHAELMREDDDRARRVAKEIYDRHIASRFVDDR